MSINNLKLLPVLVLLVGLLSACGDEVGIEDYSPPDLPPDIPVEGTQINIVETPLPIIEDFGAADTVEFFSTSYRGLATPASNDIVDDNGDTFTLTDPWPTFYYPTCCFFNTDPVTGEVIRTPPYADDLDFRLRVADNKMAISNARFSIGQILSDLTPESIADRKRDTTENPIGASLELGSWGELDLSQPYRISFCLVDYGQAGQGFSNLEVWVDNNSGGRQIESIHSQASMLLRTPVTGTGINLIAGNRLIIDVPGDAYMVDNGGNKVGLTLNVISPLDGVDLPVGTFSSFLQLRVSSGGYAVISDLIVEYQDEDNAASLTTPCTEDTTFFESLTNSQIRETWGLPGTPYDGTLPLNVDFSAGEVEFFAQLNGEGDPETTTGQYLAVSDNQYDSFYKEVGSSSRIFIDETYTPNNAIRFGQARWAMGLKEGPQDDCTAYPCPTGTPNGDLDLSSPYTITAEILELPQVTGTLQVYVDNATSSSVNSIHDTASRLMNIDSAGGLNATGTLVINVPGDITLNGGVIGSVAAHVGTSTSFIQFRCPSNCGEAVDNAGVLSGGIVLSDIVVENQ